MKTKTYTFRVLDAENRDIELEGYATNIDIVRYVFPLATHLRERPFRVLTLTDFDFDLRGVEIAP